jgi:hypothetical protein
MKKGTCVLFCKCLFLLVELNGIEPSTYALQMRFIKRPGMEVSHKDTEIMGLSMEYPR